jgi:hypothetical protein
MSAEQTVEVKVFVLVDPAGDYACGTEADQARSRYADDIGPLEDSDGFQLVEVTITLPLPRVIQVQGVIAAAADPATLVVK